MSSSQDTWWARDGIRWYPFWRIGSVGKPRHAVLVLAITFVLGMSRPRAVHSYSACRQVAFRCSRSAGSSETLSEK
jgi:hypothetical protein